MADRSTFDGGLLIFDGDDTLWETEVLYDRARDASAAVVAGQGLNADEFVTLQKAIDVANFRLMGLSPERFPTSSVQAYEQLAGDSSADARRQEVWDASAAVFDEPAEVLPGVATTLAALAAMYRLVLLTKGDRGVQHQRIQTFALVDLFDGVLIVQQKTAQTFRGVCDAFGVSAASTWSIGNSLKSDIVPAHDAGLRTVWIDAHVWAHERLDADAPAATVVIEKFSELGERLKIAR